MFSFIIFQNGVRLGRLNPREDSTLRDSILSAARLTAAAETAAAEVRSAVHVAVKYCLLCVIAIPVAFFYPSLSNVLLLLACNVILSDKMLLLCRHHSSLSDSQQKHIARWTAKL